MNNKSNKANKAINNTIILYIKMFFSLLIGFFTIRIVLKALGEIDYGIYALVGGVVATLNFLNSVLSNSTSRFLSYGLGKNNPEEVSRIFGTAVLLHTLIGLIFVILSEAGGWIIFNNLLKIPPERLVAAQWVFQLMVANTFVTVISVPYDALISSHEDFLSLSIIDILALLLKLIFVLWLLNFSADRLILYSVLMFLVSLGTRIAKQVFSRVKYKFILIKKTIDKSVLKNMLEFSSWILFGTLCSIGSSQISGIIINMFFGVRLNAANGIAGQIKDQINAFSINLTRAIMPQLMRSEGSGNRKKMLELTGVSTKFAIYLFAFFSIPIIFETTILLKLWLADVPDYSVIFCRLFLIGLLVDKFTFHLGDAIRAVGEIKWYQITESLVILLNLPISFLFYKKGYPPQTIYIVPFFLGVVVIGLRMYFAHAVAGLNIKDYFQEIVLKAMYPILGACFALFYIHFMMDESILRLAISLISSSIIFITIMTFFGLKEREKQIFYNYGKQLLRK